MDSEVEKGISLSLESTCCSCLGGGAAVRSWVTYFLFFFLLLQNNIALKATSQSGEQLNNGNFAFANQFQTFTS